MKFLKYEEESDRFSLVGFIPTEAWMFGQVSLMTEKQPLDQNGDPMKGADGEVIPPRPPVLVYESTSMIDREREFHKWKVNSKGERKIQENQIEIMKHPYQILVSVPSFIDQHMAWLESNVINNTDLLDMPTPDVSPVKTEA